MTDGYTKQIHNLRRFIMEEQLKKLSKVKKSCKAVKIVSGILFGITLFATLLTLITGIVFMSSKGKFDVPLEQAVSDGHLSFSIGNGFFKVTDNDVHIASNLESSLPSLNNKLGNASLSFAFGLYLMLISLACATSAVPCYLFYSVFNLISKEESPFSDKVIRRLLISLIIISVLINFTIGAGFGVLAGIFTWALYTIMDYGRALQTQSDETL